MGVRTLIHSRISYTLRKKRGHWSILASFGGSQQWTKDTLSNCSLFSKSDEILHEIPTYCLNQVVTTHNELKLPSTSKFFLSNTWVYVPRKCSSSIGCVETWQKIQDKYLPVSRLSVPLFRGKRVVDITVVWSFRRLERVGHFLSWTRVSNSRSAGCWWVNHFGTQIQ